MLGGDLVRPGVDQVKISSMEKTKEITDAHQFYCPKRKRQGSKIGMRLRIRKLLQSFPAVGKSNKEEV